MATSTNLFNLEFTEWRGLFTKARVVTADCHAIATGAADVASGRQDHGVRNHMRSPMDIPYQQPVGTVRCSVTDQWHSWDARIP